MHPETGLAMQMAVGVGDSVLYGKYDGSEMKYNDIDHQLIKDDDILLKYSGSEITLANAEPVKDQVLIKIAEKIEQNVGGIIVKSLVSEEDKPITGEIVKIGPGRQTGTGSIMPIDLKPGDQVRFREFGQNPVKLDGKDYLVMRAYDITAKW